MEQERDPRAVLQRAALCTTAAAGAAGTSAQAGGRTLDVLLWAVLAPLVTAAALELGAKARRGPVPVRRERAQVVVPDPPPSPRAPAAAPPARAATARRRATTP